MENANELSGGYSVYTCDLSEEAKLAFHEAMEGLLGVTYSPVAVSVQIVAGTNYRFFCNSRSSVRYPFNGSAIVSIYKPLEGNAHITNIQKIN